MTGTCWWLVELLSRMLAPDEREVARGDLAEAGATGVQALREMLGLVARRQAALWHDWRPWLGLAGLAVPLGVALSLVARRAAHSASIYIWMYANNWDWALFRNAAFRHDLAQYSLSVSLLCLALMCWSWSIGFVLGSLSRRAIPFNAAVFACMLWFAESPAAPPIRNYGANDAVFSLAFYRVALPLIAQAALVLLPALWGMRRGVRLASLRPPLQAVLWASAIALSWIWWRFPAAITWPGPESRWQIWLLQAAVYWPVVYFTLSAARRLRRVTAAVLVLALAGVTSAAGQPAVRAVLQAAGERKPAPEFMLKDAAGKTARLKQYRGKVVLLDFWATWCHGCKEEIPWFSEFERRYGARRFAVVGVSLDDEGWKALKPFLEAMKPPYRMILGNEATAKAYGIESMPDAFLIDRLGRIAATYVGLVDRDDVETNIRTMLAQR